MFHPLALCFLALSGAGTPPTSGSSAVEINVYAAASLRDALERLAPACGKEAGARLVFNFGASSDLARQIQAANKADLFLSADEEWIDRLDRAGLTDRDSRRSFLSNRLVVVGPRSGTLTVRSAGDLAGRSVRRLALANPDAVPAGKYAKAWLEKAGVWDRVKERVVPSVDVRAALAAVETGAVEAGVVYRTDAAVSRRARVLYEVPEREGPVISYALAVLKDRPERARARRLAECLAGPRGREVFRDLGFIVPEDPP